MTVFGLDAATVRDRVRGVRGGDDEAIAEAFARAAWTGIAEPGDGSAGLLVGSLGASKALTAVLEGWSPTKVADAVRAADAAVSLHGPDVEQALERWRLRLKPERAVLALRLAERVGARLLLPGDPLWPTGADDLGPHAPIALWWRGIPAALEALGYSIALVGARAATGYGEHVTMEASAGLVDRGLTIVSGAAYGIDGIAHRTALASSGLTVAFLAGGVDRFYPSGHDGLLRRIAEVGAVVAELPCGSTPTRWRFLQRNRLIAAASSATVVLEAGWRSGSLNTAGHAGSLGRPLGAVPGPVSSPTSAGCHRLFREYDAVCVTNADEMAELAGAYPGSRTGSPTSGLPGHDGPGGGSRSSEQVRAIDALSRRSPREVHDVAARAGLSITSVLAALGALNAEGVVKEREDGWVLSAPGRTS